MGQQYEDEIEIDLQELFFVVKKEIKVILLSAFLMAAIVFVFNKFIATPQYAATSELFILTKSTSLTSMADIQIGSSLTNDYMVIIEGRAVVNQVIDNLKLDETYESLKGKLSVENPTNTRILNITVTTDDPKEAKKIADEFATVSAAYIAEKMDQDPPNIIEQAFADDNPIGPKTMRNTVLGFGVGLVLMAGMVIVIHLMDDSINDPDQIEKYFGLNTLASIPVNGAMANISKDKKAKERKSGVKRVGTSKAAKKNTVKPAKRGKKSR